MLCVPYLQLDTDEQLECDLRGTRLAEMRTKKGSTELRQWRADSPIEPVRDWSTKPKFDYVLYC